MSMRESVIRLLTAALALGLMAGSVTAQDAKKEESKKEESKKEESKKEESKTAEPKNAEAKAKKAPKPKPESIVDPAKAGPDFAVQGEYVGSIGDEKIGAHVVALGEGKFDVVFYRGGLPGDGWNAKDKHKLSAVRKSAEEVALLEDDKEIGSIKAGKLNGTAPNDKAITAEKTERKSPTLGEKPPEGAVVLFDGKKETAEAAWNKVKLDDEGNLLTQGTGGYMSKQKFGDCKIHVEFRLPFTPGGRGQGRGNSGVYAAGRYETQVLDSFGLTGENNECGGIYGNYKPAVNMCFPPLTWQTYDIEYTAARFDETGKKTANARLTVVHNGVKIHDNVELTKGITTAAPVKESPEPGPIHLQDHGDPVMYRNVWVLPKQP